MRIEEGVGQPSIELPGLESRVLPGGTEIHAKPGELEFVARIVGMGIPLCPDGSINPVQESSNDPRANF